MRLIVRPDYDSVSEWAAELVARRISSGSVERPFVLGLPTGSTVLGLYERLRGLCRAGRLSFANVVTFNMDEYVGLSGDHPQSYGRFMWDNLFSGLDIKRENAHILDGASPDPARECADYEAAIAAAGGIDLFVGGIGANGHLAFNEPGSPPSSRTRMVRLSGETRSANARFFGGDPASVPEAALTVGIGTVADASEVLILASGLSKARAVRRAVEEGVNQLWPVSALQAHPKCVFACDEDAASELKLGTLRYFRDIESGEGGDQRAIGLM